MWKISQLYYKYSNIKGSLNKDFLNFLNADKIQSFYPYYEINDFN